MDGDAAPGLTNWKKEPTLRELKLDWESAKESHDLQVGKINHWNDLLHVRNSAKPKAIKGRSKVQPKLIRRQAEWRYSALTEPFLGSEKLFKVKPATFEDAKSAKQNELVLNHQFRTQLNKVKFIDDYVRSTVDEGTCIVQVGWCRYTVKVTTEVPVYDHIAIKNDDELGLLKAALELRLSDPRTYNETTPPELKAAVDYFDETQIATVAQDNGQTTTVEEDKILKNHPTAEIRNPQNVYIDPSCNGDIDKATFIGVTFETCKADLLKDGRYKNLDQVNWSGSTPLSTPDHETTTPQNYQPVEDLRKKVVAYEYWGFADINDDEKLVPIVATWVGNTLIRMELNPFPDQKLPFVLVPYLPVKRDVYGEPDAELLEDNQNILGAVSRGLIDLLGRSANGQQGFAKGMLDPLNRRRYEQGLDYEFNPNVSPALGLIEHKYPEIPQSALAMLGLQNQEAEALTGVKSFSGGMSGEAYGDVAAGIRGVLDAASKREMAILRRLAKGITEIGEKFAMMNAEFLSEEETIRITNEQFETVLREDLAGEFDIIVDISTAEVDNAQAQDLSFMLQTIGNTLPQEFTLLILSEIAQLKKMPELAHKLLTFKPQPDPLQEQMKQLELKKLEMEVEELQSKIDLNRAKAEEASSKADLADLGFVAKESGTEHRQELEKLKAQGQGNIDHTITKALVTPRKEGESKPDIEGAVGFRQLSSVTDDKNDTPPVADQLPVVHPVRQPTLPEGPINPGVA
jgi:hypothetical protein